MVLRGLEADKRKVAKYEEERKQNKMPEVQNEKIFKIFSTLSLSATLPTLLFSLPFVESLYILSFCLLKPYLFSYTRFETSEKYFRARNERYKVNDLLLFYRV